MRKLLLVVLAALLVLPAASAFGAPGWHGGGGHGGFRGGFRGRIGVNPFWGWGWGWGPYDYGAYYYPGYGPGRGYGAFPSDWAVVDTDVSPEEASVSLDGRYIGTADDFDGNPDFLYLRPGQYKLEFRLEGYESQTVNVDARPGVKLDLKNTLRKIPGARQYGSYDAPRPEGGVFRYWGKRHGAPEPYDGGPPAREEPDRDDVQAEPDDQAPPAPPAERPGEGRRSPGLRSDGWRQGAPAAARPMRYRARLLLSVQPFDAAVYVDDRFVGIADEIAGTERGVPLSPGKHTVTVSRPGFKERTVEIEVAAGESKKIDVSLGK